MKISGFVFAFMLSSAANAQNMQQLSINDNTRIRSGAVAMSSDGKMIINEAIHSGQDSIMVWRGDSFAETYVVGPFRSKVSSIDINSDSDRFILGHESGQVSVFTLDGLELEGSFQPLGRSSPGSHPTPRTLVKFVFGGTHALVTQGFNVALLDLNAEQLQTFISPEQFWAAGGRGHRSSHGNFVRAIAVNEDETLLASGDRDEVRLWDIKTGDLVNVFSRPEEVDFSRIHIDEESSRLLAVDRNRVLTIWDLESTQIISSVELIDPSDESRRSGSLNDAEFFESGRRIVLGNRCGATEIWDTITASRLNGHQQEGNCLINDVHGVAVSSDGNTVVSSGGAGIGVWSIEQD